MSEFVVSWGQDEYRVERLVTTPDEMDAALDLAADSGDQWCVTIAPKWAFDLPADLDPWDPDNPYQALEIGLGHPERSYAFWYGRDESWGLAGPDCERGELPPWPGGAEAIEFIYGNQPIYRPQDEACLSPATARRLAHEYFRSGRSPLLRVGR